MHIMKILEEKLKTSKIDIFFMYGIITSKLFIHIKYSIGLVCNKNKARTTPDKVLMKKKWWDGVFFY